MTNSSRELTSYIKGIAILTVIVGHFSMRFMPTVLPLFGNHFIAFFFALSGFGLYYSLSKFDTVAGNTWKFYFTRFKRIYPLYWVNFFADLVLDPNTSIGMGTVLDFFLLHFTDPPRVWFLHALIPCYVFAPAIFSVIRRLNGKSFVIFLGGLLLIDYLAAYLGFPYVRCWKYKNIYFSEYFIFACGMLIAHMKSKLKSNHTVVIFSAVLFIVACFFTSGHEYFAWLPFNNTIVPSFAFLFSVLFFVSVFVNATDIFLPLKRVLCLIGSYTYSLYLFEGMFATALDKVGIINGHSTFNLVVFVLVFPVFLVGCILIEEFFGCNFNPPEAFRRMKNAIVR